MTMKWVLFAHIDTHMKICIINMRENCTTGHEMSVVCTQWYTIANMHHQHAETYKNDYEMNVVCTHWYINADMHHQPLTCIDVENVCYLLSMTIYMHNCVCMHIKTEHKIHNCVQQTMNVHKCTDTQSWMQYGLKLMVMCEHMCTLRLHWFTCNQQMCNHCMAWIEHVASCGTLIYVHTNLFRKSKFL